MKTSIFDMNFVLPPVVEMTEVEKDMPQTGSTNNIPHCRHCQENNMKTSILGEHMKTSIFDMRQMLSTVTRQPTTVGYFLDLLQLVPNFGFQTLRQGWADVWVNSFGKTRNYESCNTFFTEQTLFRERMQGASILS